MADQYWPTHAFWYQLGCQSRELPLNFYSVQTRDRPRFPNFGLNRNFFDNFSKSVCITFIRFGDWIFFCDILDYSWLLITTSGHHSFEIILCVVLILIDQSNQFRDQKTFCSWKHLHLVGKKFQTSLENVSWRTRFLIPLYPKIGAHFKTKSVSQAIIPLLSSNPY